MLRFFLTTALFFSLLFCSRLDCAPMVLDGLVSPSLIGKQRTLSVNTTSITSNPSTLWKVVGSSVKIEERLFALWQLTALPAKDNAEVAANLLNTEKDFVFRRALARALCCWGDQRGDAFLLAGLTDAKDEDQQLLALGDICFIPRTPFVKRELNRFSLNDKHSEKLRLAARRIARTGSQQLTGKRSSSRWIFAIVIFALFLIIACVESRKA